MFVQKNFLLIVVLLSVVFAVAMRATVYQKDPAPAPLPALSVPERQFSDYWQRNRPELVRYRIQTADTTRLTAIGSATLTSFVSYLRADTHLSANDAARAVRGLRSDLAETSASDEKPRRRSCSVFTPIDRPEFPQTLRVTASTDDYGGHHARQLDYRTGKFSLSDGEIEAPQPDYTLEKTLLEDELWTRIRLNPAKLPTGDISILPSLTARQHRLYPQSATASRADSASAAFRQPGLQAYSVRFDKMDRTLTIWFERDFPHRIVGWEEQSGAQFRRALQQTP